MTLRKLANTRFASALLAFSIVSVPALAQQAAPAAPPAAPEAAPSVAPLSESLTGTAKSDYDAGKVLYLDGDFAGALIKFQAAFEASKDPRLLWNMAASEKNLRHYGRALTLLERYEREGADKLTEQDRADAATLRQALTPYVGRITVTANQPGATVFVDGEEVGTTPLTEPLLVDIGTHTIRVTKAGYVDFSTKHSVSGGPSGAVNVTLEQQKTSGTLIVNAGTKDEIRIDGKVVGIGSYTGSLPAGKHHVVVRNAGYEDYQSDVVVEAGGREQVSVKLDRKDEGGGLPTWAWITGGVLAAGLGAGAFILLRPEEEGPAPVQGTLDPGIVQLRFSR